MSTSSRPAADAGPLPVVLLGGTNLVRCLGLAGIPAIVATPDPDEPALASKHCGDRLLLPPYSDPHAVVDALVALGQRLCGRFGRRPPLMYGNDNALELIDAHRDRLQRYYLLLLNEPEVAAALIEKDRFQQFALRRGLPVPRVLRWTGDGVDSVGAHAGPVLVKPKVKVDWHDSPLRTRLFAGAAKARIFASGAAAASDAAVALLHEQLLFQEYIPGDDGALWSFHGIADENGHVLTSFVGRKIRTHPPLTGESAYIEMADEPSLEAVGRDVAARIPLCGAFKMDFKRDGRDATWRLLEINARFNLWHYLGAANGINLPQAAYAFLVSGVPPAPVAPRRRYRWLALDLDFRAYRILAARGELTFWKWLGSILGARKVYNVFAWHDPGPWIFLWRQRFARRFARGPRQVAQVVRQWRSKAS